MKYRLILTSASVNSNKFWFADVTGSKVVRRWGRVGKKGQTKTFDYYASWEAEEVTDKVARSKYRKGYRDLDLVDEDAARIVAGSSLEQLAMGQIVTNGDRELVALVKFLVRTNVHAITSRTKIRYEDGQLKTALGVISQRTIDRARSTLDRIGVFVQRSGQRDYQFVRLVEDYLVLVPTDIGMKFTPHLIFPDIDAVREQYDILDSMEALLTLPTDGEQVFDLTIEEVPAPELATIGRKFLADSNRQHRSHGMKLKRAWKVSIGSDKDFESDLGNVQLLWHGTKASNLLAILKSGMKIIPSGAAHIVGRMFGDGLYFSNQSTKSLNYATTFWGGRDEGRYFMLSVDVAMGRSYTPTGPSYNLHNSLPRGRDSCFARAHQSGVMNNEMVVYRESQARIKYLVEFSKR